MKSNSEFSQQQTALRGRSSLETEKAIEMVKNTFTAELSDRLNLHKVSAPLLVRRGSGLNDDLNGTERPVHFSAPSLGDTPVEIVHSLAKWKRMKVSQLDLNPGEGIVADMRAIRADEELSPVHSLYVDQWDWEKCIRAEERNLTTLKEAVKNIYAAIKATEEKLGVARTGIEPILPEEITFIHTEDLQRRYPELNPKEREDVVTRAFGAVFLIGIGGVLGGGEPHDGRAPDYDDWSTPTEGSCKGLNGDILVWNPLLERAFELSSMGIRVDAAALERQLAVTCCMERTQLPFHADLLAGRFSQTMGGGIGQSRLCMFLLRKRHIGEVQASLWPEGTCAGLEEQGICLL